MNAISAQLIPKILSGQRVTENPLTQAALILAGIISNDLSNPAIQAAIVSVQRMALSSENPEVWIAALLADLAVTGAEDTALDDSEVLDQLEAIISGASPDQVLTTNSLGVPSFQSGLTNNDPINSIDRRIAGLTGTVAQKTLLSTVNPNVSYVRSATCWAADIDTTPIAVWCGEGGTNINDSNGWKRAIAISPIHVVMAVHFSPAIGQTFDFLTAGNLKVTRTLVARVNVIGTDIYIGKLSSELPDTISFCRILPNDYTGFSLIGMPVLELDQTYRVLVNDITADNGVTIETSTTGPTDATRTAFYELLVAGDSSSPLALVVGNELVLLAAAATAFGGPSLAGFRTAVDAAMTTLGGGYTTTAVVPGNTIWRHSPYWDDVKGKPGVVTAVIVPEPNGVDDTAAIEAAWAELVANGGGHMHLRKGLYKTTSNLLFEVTGVTPRCFEITGEQGTIIQPSAAVTVAVTLSTEVANLITASRLKMGGIWLDGSLTSGATGLLVGSSLSGYMELDDVIITEFDGASSKGLYVKDTIRFWAHRVYVGHCGTGLYFNASNIALPTTCYFDTCDFMQSQTASGGTGRGVDLVRGHRITFKHCHSSYNKAEGFYCVPGGADAAGVKNALWINWDDVWGEGNFDGSGAIATNYHFRIDGTGAGTVMVTLKDANFVGGARAAYFKNAGNCVLDNVTTQNAANQVVIDVGCTGEIHNWPSFPPYDTVVTNAVPASFGSIQTSWFNRVYVDPTTKALLPTATGFYDLGSLAQALKSAFFTGDVISGRVGIGATPGALIASILDINGTISVLAGSQMYFWNSTNGNAATMGCTVPGTGTLTFSPGGTLALSLLGAGGAEFTGAVKTLTTTAAGLPAAGTVGRRAFITDNNTTLTLGIGLAAVGGGANKVPVYDDGTSWIVG